MEASKLSPHAIDLERAGTKIVLPVGMSFDDAIDWIANRKEQEETFTSVIEYIDGYPLEAMIALNRVMRERYDWRPADQGSSTQSIPVGAGKAEEVTFDRINPKMWEGGWVRGRPGMMPGGGKNEALSLTFSVKGKHLADAKQLAALVREEVSKRSIYKGSAVVIDYTEGMFGSQMDAPQFWDVSSVKPGELIFSEQVEQQIATSLFAPIERTDECKAAGIPLKRGVLLYGPFGTGKTLTAKVAAKKATDHGWTFVYLKDVRRLPELLPFVLHYQPAVLFAEDLDQALGDDVSVSLMLNALDSVLVKDAELITVLTTNHLGKIAAGMLRPGRLDALISVEPPDAGAALRLVNLYGRGLLKSSADYSEVAAKLDGTIPALIREVVERSKLSAIRRGGKLVLLPEDLLLAADGLQTQRALLTPKKADKRSPVEKAAATVGEALVTAAAEVAGGMVPQHTGGWHEASSSAANVTVAAKLNGKGKAASK